MKVERLVLAGCCNKVSLIFKIDRPITRDFIDTLSTLGFTESPQFTKAGLLYMDNLDFILTGPIGTNRLQVQCRYKDCDLKLNELEGLLLQME